MMMMMLVVMVVMMMTILLICCRGCTKAAANDNGDWVKLPFKTWRPPSTMMKANDEGGNE